MGDNGKEKATENKKAIKNKYKRKSKAIKLKQRTKEQRNVKYM